MNRSALIWGIAVLVVASFAGLAAAESRPNIIYILTDDLGYGDLGCYGQKTLRTPHLDRLANEGIRFTRHYAGSTVCSPSRCVLLTGRHSGHARIRSNGPGLLTSQDTTIGDVLQTAGYRTGCFGKWGVGNPIPDNNPRRHGFHEFYGYVNMFHAHNFYPEFLIRNGRKVPLGNRLFPEWKARETLSKAGGGVAEVAVDYAPQIIFEEALEFIRKNRNQPFFLYYAPNLPHANNEGGGERRIANDGMRVPDWGEFADRDWPNQEKGFARMIQILDEHVGEIVRLLQELNLDERTAIFFTSDNGPHSEGRHKMNYFDSNGPLRGMKRDLYEGGIRVPLIARWPGKFPAGIESGLISGFQDMLPTMAELAGAAAPQGLDGISLAPTLLGRPAAQILHPHLYWEFYEYGGTKAVMQGNWKAVRRNFIRHPENPVELYNLAEDIGETRNLAEQHPALARTLAGIMDREHTAP